MGIESGPSFYEGEPAVSEFARAELMLDLATEKARLLGEGLTREIARNPELDAMLGKLIECGPDMDPHTKAHLRRMISLWIGTHRDMIVDANHDVDFFRTVLQELQSELDEMADFETDLSELPDLWDIAYKDLLDLENGSD